MVESEGYRRVYIARKSRKTSQESEAHNKVTRGSRTFILFRRLFGWALLFSDIWNSCVLENVASKGGMWGHVTPSWNHIGGHMGPTVSPRNRLPAPSLLSSFTMIGCRRNILLLWSKSVKSTASKFNQKLNSTFYWFFAEYFFCLFELFWFCCIFLWNWSTNWRHVFCTDRFF